MIFFPPGIMKENNNLLWLHKKDYLFVHSDGKKNTVEKFQVIL